MNGEFEDVQLCICFEMEVFRREGIVERRKIELIQEEIVDIILEIENELYVDVMYYVQQDVILRVEMLFVF